MEKTTKALWYTQKINIKYQNNKFLLFQGWTRYPIAFQRTIASSINVLVSASSSWREDQWTWHSQLCMEHGSKAKKKESFLKRFVHIRKKKSDD